MPTTQATKNLRRHLLIIDPQNDFCDLPESDCPVAGGIALRPSLPVAGAHGDMQRLATLIDDCSERLDAISVTLDAHQHLDIAHPTFWCDAAGAAVAPFTMISLADLQAGRYRPLDAQAFERVAAYLTALEATGRYTHMVWPVHCEIGTWGQAIHTTLQRALNRWEEASLCNVAKIAKGQNPWTEHYSAMMAEVPDPADAATQLNCALLHSLQSAERIYIAGEAGSHCVKATTEHIVAHWPPHALSKLALIRDCISPVSGFEAQYAAFITAMHERGVSILSADDVRAELA